MAQPLLSNSVNKAVREIDKLQKYKNESEYLEAKYQHFISEIIMLRLFSVFEDYVADIAYKLAAGAEYLNGAKPSLNVVAARSVVASRTLFLTYGRSKSIQNLKWTKSKFIKDSVQHVIPITESFVINAQKHGAIINEMRVVRNVLAHNSTSAKVDFKDVVRIVYGVNISNMTAGAFLTSTRRKTPCNLNRYIQSTKIVLNELASGK